jgi:hypothetical protein
MKKFEKLSLVKLHDEELKKVIGGSQEVIGAKNGIIMRPLYGIQLRYGIVIDNPAILYAIKPAG